MFKKIFKGNDDNSKSKRKVIVLSADHGLVGRALLPGLVSRNLLDVYAGVSNPTKFGHMEGVTLVKVDMEDKRALNKTFKSKKFDRVILVVPGNRPDWAETALEAADVNKYVKFVLVISLIMAAPAAKDTYFGQTYSDMEKAAKHYFPFGHCIVRLPLLLDAMVPLYAPSIRATNSYKDPRDPTKPFRCIALSDVAQAVTQIIIRPANHEGQLYHLVGPSVTLQQQTDALSKALRKKITLQAEHYEQYQETLEEARVPEWSINGTFEMYRLMDDESPITNAKDNGDFAKLVGGQQQPMSLEAWCQTNRMKFLE